VLQLLRERDMTAGELAGQFPVTKPTMSRHFAILQEADLIQGDKQGTAITYRLNVSVLEETLLALMDSFGLAKAAAMTTRLAKPRRPATKATTTMNARIFRRVFIWGIALSAIAALALAIASPVNERNHGHER
jgi:ArsR family transcriptional regulator, arsenate/arsenite/antimonite-responsive transcriptional repressor